MTFTADFVLADKREARQVAASAAPADAWPGVSYKGLNCLDMAALYGALLGKASEDDIFALFYDSFEQLIGPDEGVDLRLFPADFTALLAAVAPARLGPVARAWRAAEEAVHRWTSQGTEEALAGLCQLARRAVHRQKPILLRVTGFYPGPTGNGDILEEATGDAPED
jgi:hypothetical protein